MAGLLGATPLPLEWKIYLLGREVVPLPSFPDAASRQPAGYDVLFPVRLRVLGKFTQDEIELAARVAFWQHPPDECGVPEQEPDLEWVKDMPGSGTAVIRVSGDVIPPPVPDLIPSPVPGEE